MFSTPKLLSAALVAALLAACGGPEIDSSQQAAKGLPGGGGGGGGAVTPPATGGGGGATKPPSISLKGAMAPAAAFPNTSGAATFVDSGGRISFRATVTTSDLPDGTLLCEYADGALISCASAAGAGGLPPVTASFRIDTVSGTVGLALHAGSIVDVRLGVDVGAIPADTSVASAVLQ